jgi:hypothetical protein
MNYTEIIHLALSYADRTDSDIGIKMPGFLFMVESKLNRYLESLELEALATIPYTADNVYTYSLPSDFGKLRSVFKITTGDVNSKVPYELINTEQIAVAKQNNSGAMYYSLNVNSIEIYPSLASTDSILLKYIKHVPPLTSTNTTNWLSIKYPDVYVFGLLVEINTFAKDWDAVNNFKERLNEIIEETITRDFRAKYSGNSMRTRLG